MMLKHLGIETFGHILDRNIAQAHHLAGRIASEGKLELMAPVASTIVCFRHDPGSIDEAALHFNNTDIKMRLQEMGIALLADISLRGRHCLRLAICNHRTCAEDLDLLVDEVLKIGAQLDSGRTVA